MNIRRLSSFIIDTVLFTCAISLAISAPQIKFDKETLEFGKVVSGNPIRATFTFTNTGDAELDITDVHPGCGCTHAEALQKKVAPGRSGYINATFNSTGFSGPISKYVTVSSNDPSRASLQIYIKAEIVPVAKISPERLNFGSLKVNGKRTYMVRVIPGDPKSFILTKIVPSGTHVTVPTFKKVETKTGTYWELFVVVTADSKPGRVMESMSIMNNAGENTTILVQVFGNIIE